MSPRRQPLKRIAILVAVPLLVTLGWVLHYKWMYRLSGVISELGGPQSTEGIMADNLRWARFRWLRDGCPQPPDAERYLSQGTFTNFAYPGLIVVSNQDFQGLKLVNRTFRGLFASKVPEPASREPYQNTLVITFTGEFLSITPSGEARLREFSRDNL
jgi:hypothetical protein